MNLSDIDCPQYISFTSPSFQDSLCVQDERRTPSPLQFKQSQNSPLLEKAKSENCHSVVDSPIIATDQSNSSVKNSTLRSPLTDLDSLENSLEEFPVKKNNHFITSTDIKQYKSRCVTQFQEFQLTQAAQKENNKYVTLAEQVAAFQTKTPARFHTVGPKEYEPVERWVPPIVNPKSPELQAVKRCRLNTAISQKDQEEKEVQEMKNYRFHAKPLNSKALSKPFVPKKKKRQVTIPKDIKLKTAERAELHCPKEDDERYEFHAMPVPKVILTGPTGLREKVSLPTTVAMSPAFALKEREQKWKAKNKSDMNLDKVEEFHAHPAPSASSPFVVKHEAKVTEFKPFSFHEKDKERYALKKRKIDEIIEKESKVPQFKAQALPNIESRLSCTAIRSNRCKELDTTNTAPRVFRARPATVLKKPPFVPQKAPVEIPAFKEFQLHTEKRVEEWNKIKERNRLIEMEKEQILLQKKAEEEEKEREEIKKLRSELVHKANPIRTFKSVEIKHSEKPLTKPKSPNFETKKRLQKSHSRSSEQGFDSKNSSETSQE